jgi:hypothetical protein
LSVNAPNAPEKIFNNCCCIWTRKDKTHLANPGRVRRGVDEIGEWWVAYPCTVCVGKHGIGARVDAPSGNPEYLDHYGNRYTAVLPTA